MKGQALLLSLLLAVTITGCKNRLDREKKTQTEPPVTISRTTNPPAVKPATVYPYRPSETKRFDLIHTQLEVSFDMARQRMNGKAFLTLRPWFAPQNKVVLDAKGFLIHNVALEGAPTPLPLKYSYDNARLTVELDRTYTQAESLRISVQYTARPTELDSLVSADAAEDQGLYFVNASGAEAGKPVQIWTQGESHGSPGWFPTFDTPNQRCTSEIAITVPDSFQTLSNGLLVRSESKAPGMRTDHWKMDLPHAPYLFMMAIGKYEVVKDQWRGREVSYYVEPKYAPYARLIFGNTPEMLEFFSTKLGVEYPWPKYSQVVVRDFVSGAMENTSATTHFEKLQHDARQHLENTYEDIVSHELFHQWFGDLVTCESWANLSLNEGFATYGEYLWNEHKYGHDEATMHLLEDRQAYVRSATRQKFPIIRYQHRDADAMFDAHSYQKGGQVLHMLRKYVGDEAFFSSLKRYLTTNAYDDVEIHELRLAFEEVTGEDLNWFFDQWYLAPGHPVVTFTHQYEDGKYRLHIAQLQDLNTSPVFRLPIPVEFVQAGKSQIVNVWMQTADTTFVFETGTQPDYVVVDPERDLLLEIRDDAPVKEADWQTIALQSKGYARKAYAIGALDLAKLGDQDLEKVLALAKDPFWGTRLLLQSRLEDAGVGQRAAALSTFVDQMDDPIAQVRIGAVMSIHSNGQSLPPSLKEMTHKALIEGILDSSYTVSQFSLETFHALFPAEGLAKVKELIAKPEPHLVGMVAKILKDGGSPEALPYILGHIRDPKTENGAKIAMLRGLGGYLKGQSPDALAQGTQMLMDVVASNSMRWVRMTAVQSLTELVPNDAIKTFFMERAKSEQDEIIRASIQRYLDAD